MGEDDGMEPGEYASPACSLYELDPAFAGLTPPPQPKHADASLDGQPPTPVAPSSDPGLKPSHQRARKAMPGKRAIS
jgi:hypothetical protein